MVTPVLIQIIFWAGIALCLAMGWIHAGNGYTMLKHQIGSTSAGRIQLVIALAYLILGPVIIRVICEFWILFYRMNETLTEILNEISKLERP